MLTDKVVEQAYLRRQENKGTYKELAGELLGDPSRDKELRVAVEAYGKRLDFQIPYTEDEFPPHYPAKLFFPKQIDYKPTLLIADLHCPFLARNFLQLAVQEAKDHGVTRVIIAGDVFDGNSLSAYKKAWEPVTSIRDDLLYGYQTMRYLVREFGEVHVTPGNHDEWVMNHFGISAKELFDLDRVYAEQMPYLIMGECLIGHLDQYNNIPGELASKIASKARRHTFVGHDHIAGIIYGDYNGVSIGGMLNESSIYYKATSFNALPHWKNGFVIFDADGYANCYHQSYEVSKYARFKV